MYCRCLPEIIGFCNELCYDNRLVPLTESEPSYGPAVQHEWVPEGLCVGSGVKLQNEKEAKTIVSRVRNSVLVHLFICLALSYVLVKYSCSFMCACQIFDLHTSYFAFFQVKRLIEEDKDKQKKRSIGIISLWHVEQALLINRLLDEDADIASRHDLHRIRCSDARLAIRKMFTCSAWWWERTKHVFH